MGNHKLEIVTEDDALKFHKQIAASIKKANNMLGSSQRRSASD